jgi:ABC-type antimicrobial peptide transport system permease subunit
LVSACSNKSNNIWSSSPLAGIFFAKIIALQAFDFFGNVCDDAKELQAERVKAINHVKRAIYDIDESLLIYYIESAANFKEKYNDSGFTTEVVTDYPEKLATLDKANKSIQQLRENNNNYKNRQQFYQQLSPHLDKLSEIVAIFEQSAPLIANKQQDKDNQDLKNKRYFFIMTFIGIISIIVALIK